MGGFSVFVQGLGGQVPAGRGAQFGLSPTGLPHALSLLAARKRPDAFLLWFLIRSPSISWKNSISLCPASFCTPSPNLPVTPGIS